MEERKGFLGLFGWGEKLERFWWGWGPIIFSMAHQNAFSPIWRENYADFLPPFQLLFFPIVITLNRYLSSLFDFFLFFFFLFLLFALLFLCWFVLFLFSCSFFILLTLFTFFPLYFFFLFLLVQCSLFIFFYFFLNVINIIHLKNNGERNIITKRIFIFDVLLLF